MLARRRFAVLGAGIMGSSLALLLARRGHEVVLVDKAAAPMSAASRWNEGKIHLGYLYGADPSLATARRVLPGGLAFNRIVRDLVGADLEPHFTAGEDVYLVHDRSVVDVQSLHKVFAAIDGLVAEQAEGAERARLLTPAELSGHTTSAAIAGGLAVPERSIDTNWLAGRYVAALSAEPGIDLRMTTTVTGAAPVEAIDGQWQVEAQGVDGVFDIVINALWEGRLAVDVTAGLPPEPGWSHRYRLCLFVTTARRVEAASAVVAIGPFGDFKNYDGTHFYISWYPTGLRAESTELTLAAPPPLDRAAEADFVGEVRRGIVPLIPGVGHVLDSATDIKVRGGYVFAHGQGPLDQAKSTIHRRDRFGVRRRGSYVSVDTGKFSTAPWLAEQLVAELGA